MTTNQNVSQATVRRSMLRHKSAPESLTFLDAVCSAGAQCLEVQSSPIAQAALGVLQDAVTAAHASLTNKEAIAKSLMAALKTLDVDLGAVQTALDTYSVSVVAVAKGNAALINKAGLPSRDKRAPPAALEKVSAVVSKPGDNPQEAIVSWPAAAGAIAYTPEVNFTPQDPNGPWTALTPGSGRRRVVKAPQPGAQFLVRIAALGNGNQQSAWSDPILATAR
jgi:hypothetical protein